MRGTAGAREHAKAAARFFSSVKFVDYTRAVRHVRQQPLRSTPTTLALFATTLQLCARGDLDQPFFLAFTLTTKVRTVTSSTKLLYVMYPAR